MYEGGSLAQEIERYRPHGMTEDHAMYIFTQICLGFVAVHSRGIAHKDIKPDNIYIDCFGRYKIGGLVRIGGKKTKGPANLLNYLAPEVHQGQSGTMSSDIWSIGVLLYEMLTGRLPFMGDTENGTWRNIVQSEPSPLPQHISPEVKKLVSLLLSKSPDRRPAIDKILITKLVTRYVKTIVSYGRLTKNQHDLLKAPEDEENEDKTIRKKGKSKDKRVQFKDEEQVATPAISKEPQ